MDHPPAYSHFAAGKKEGLGLPIVIITITGWCFRRRRWCRYGVLWPVEHVVVLIKGSRARRRPSHQQFKWSGGRVGRLRVSQTFRAPCVSIERKKKKRRSIWFCCGCSLVFLTGFVGSARGLKKRFVKRNEVIVVGKEKKKKNQRGCLVVVVEKSEESFRRKANE